MSKDGTSKFKGVLDAARKRESAPTLVDVLAGRPRDTPAPAPTDRKRGGKRSDPDCIQITAYVRKDTYRKVKSALFEDGRESSDLIQELLSQWIDQREE